MITTNILHVFTDNEGKFGNPLGIIVDENNLIDKSERQKIALQNGYCETVFINNITERNISIYNSTEEIPFAGHAVVGTSYFLNKKYNLPIKYLVGIKGVIESWSEESLIWVKGDLVIMPEWNFEQLESAISVDKLTFDQTILKEHTFVWAWIDKVKGLIRARTFANDWEIPEDEANGSGSMLLAVNLNRNLVIHHGKGSVIYARPSQHGFGEVGGLVIFGLIAS